MTALLLFFGSILCVAGVIRGTARTRGWSFRSTAAVALFWSSLIGCLSAVTVLAAFLLMAAMFDETRDMNPAFLQVRGIAMSALRASSVVSLSLHLLLVLIPHHGVTTKSNAA